MVRAQNGGQNAYVGIYIWNNGSPNLMLFKRSGSNWTQLGSTYNSGALAAGTQLQVTVPVPRSRSCRTVFSGYRATDSTLTGGAPGIMAFGTSHGRQLVRRGRVGGSFSVGGAVSGLLGHRRAPGQRRR